MNKKSYYFKRFTELRLENKKTQKDIADYLGISEESYSQHETDGKLSMTNVIKLAQLYNVSIDYILGASDVRNIVDIKE